ncbi:MAG: PTS sugar transporter subunit IIA [Candidatus Binatia bacterium]
MKAAEVIEAGGILLRPPLGSFEDAIRALVDSLIARRQIGADLRESTIRAVCDREELSSTAIVEIGVAVPHARLAGVAGVVAALAASPHGIYHAMTGVPISVVVLVCSAPDLIGEHLNMLAGVSMLLQSDPLRRALERAADRATALRILRRDNGDNL